MRQFLAALLAIALFLSGPTPVIGAEATSVAATESSEGEWQTLIDPELSQWEAFIGVPHTSVDLEGFPKSDDVREGTPLGLNNDPKQVFSVVQRLGEYGSEPVLSITGEIYGGLTTLKAYSDYCLELEFRWLDKKWPPRDQMKRDSGILYHCTGEHGAFWHVWMRSLECQVQEGDCGDFFPLAGTRAMAPATWEKGAQPRFDLAADQVLIGSGNYRCQISESKELPNGEWNKIEVHTLADKAVHLVNGEVVMRLHDAHTLAAGKKQPLTSGRIQIQSEGAAVEYRRIRIRPITLLPE